MRSCATISVLVLAAVAGCGSGPSKQEQAAGATAACGSFETAAGRLAPPTDLAAIGSWEKTVDGLWDDAFRPKFKAGPVSEAFEEAGYSAVSLSLGGKEAAAGNAERAAELLDEAVVKTATFDSAAAALNAPACKLVGFRETLKAAQAVARSADDALTTEQRYINRLRYHWRLAVQFNEIAQYAPVGQRASSVAGNLRSFIAEVEKEVAPPSLAGASSGILERTRSLLKSVQDIKGNETVDFSALAFRQLEITVYLTSLR